MATPASPHEYIRVVVATAGRSSARLGRVSTPAVESPKPADRRSRNVIEPAGTSSRCQRAPVNVGGYFYGGNTCRIIRPKGENWVILLLLTYVVTGVRYVAELCRACGQKVLEPWALVHGGRHAVSPATTSKPSK